MLSSNFINKAKNKIMDLNLADQYYLKALDYYPFNLECTIENINYALSHDNEHAASNCLLGQIFMFQLKDFEKAGRSFYNALKGDINYPDTYKYYSLLRIWQGEYDRALKIINRGLHIKGMDHSVLLGYKANLYECQGDFEMAKLVLERAQLFCIEKNKIDQVKRDLGRIKQKIKKQKRLQRKMRKRSRVR